MSSSIITALLWAAALSSGIIAGVYFAFSGFIMQAFSKIDATQAIAAMNAINETILRSLFMLLFFGSSIISALLIIIAFVHWNEAGAKLMLIAGAVYFIGMFVCTVLFNVPLNNSLARLDPNSTNTDTVWFHYLKTWTNWNHLRTVSSLVTCILCTWLLSNY
jgi:uncharacterized membrane protein